MVRDFQRVIGLEARVQIQERVHRLPDAVTACVGGGSNAIGIFHAFIDDPSVRLMGFEAAGDGVETGGMQRRLPADRRARSRVRTPTCCRTRTARPSNPIRSQRVWTTRVGPEHAYLKDIGRGIPAGDRREAMDAFRLLCRTEGIIPAIESAHAVAGALKLGAELGDGAVIVVNLSGRGDKDVATAAKWFGLLDGGTDE
jgi:tryptophan synthase beta chain